MNLYGIQLSVQNVPSADPDFIPLGLFFQAYSQSAGQPFAIAIERNSGYVSVYDTKIQGVPELFEADCYYIERLVKLLLWVKGGVKVTLCGDAPHVMAHMQAAYQKGGLRDFDFHFMARIYERPFALCCAAYADKPAEVEMSKSVGRHLEGCRIGFDAGGSDRKVSAVIDGEPVYSEEVVWFPKTNPDPDYHFKGIVDAFRTAAEKMPRVDAIGISSAGVYVDNRTMAASLFLKVPDELFESKVKDIYIRAGQALGADIPIEVANDGDITALAGAMSLNDDCVLGIAMGTSQAGGYVDAKGNITGWLNELAFVPVDAQPNAMRDEWSGDIGCGVKYFSQDGVIKLAARVGIALDESLSPGEKLKVVQEYMDKNDPRAVSIFESIGVYLGHSVSLYCQFYDIKHILLLGRVMSGEGGSLIYKNAVKTLKEEYPDICGKVELHLPDEKIRRVGQSVAAASLPTV